MAEDLPAEEILKQIVARLDSLERVLSSNTARLHFIELHLGMVVQPQPLPETPAENHHQNPATSHVETQDFDSAEASQPTAVLTPPLDVSEETWPQPESQPPEQTWLRSDADSSPQSETHSWMNEPSSSHTYATRESDAPFTLHPHVDKPAEKNERARAEAEREEKRRDLESMVGGSWFNWIGIIAVTLGVGFFLKLAFDKQWIGPVGRVTLAASLGFVLLYLGERLRRRGLRSYAYILSGGGVLILYLSNFAAHNIYHLIGQSTAFLLMAAVTATAVLLSVRLNALPVALLGLVGGFLTPLVLSTGVDNEVGLFTYIAVLDAGVLAVAYFKRWRSLDFASFAGTVAIALGWASKFFEPGKVWPTLFFLSVFFLLYSLLAFFHNVLPGRPTRWFDVALALANASFYFGFSYVMLVESGLDHVTPATQAFLVSILFTWLFYATWRWSPDDLLLRYSYVGAAATFLTIAIAIQLELHWVTIAWAIEALMLTWAGLRSGERSARDAGLVIFCVAVAHWFIWDLLAMDYSVDPSFLPLLNRRALSCAVLVGAIAGAARLYRRTDQLDETERSTVLTFFALTGNTVALTLLSLDINDYFAAREATSAADLHERIVNARDFSITVLWTLYGATVFAVGALRRSLLLRLGGLGLLLVAIVKVLFVDSAFYAASWHLSLFNHTFMAYPPLVAALAFCAWLYGRAPGVDERERRALVPLLIGSANVIALAALSLEVVGYYDRVMAGPMVNTFSAEILRQFQEGKIFTLALVWTIYALYAFMIGVVRSARAWRLGGLLLLAVTTLLVLMNLSYYDAPWHAFVFNRTLIIFAVFIAALWLIVRTYARSGDAFEEESAVRPVAIVLANVLAIVALSAQAAGYYDVKIAEEFGRAEVLAVTMGTSQGLRNLELAKQLSLSVVWALYASGLLVVGHVRRLRLLRVMALALLSVTTLKAFLWDLSSLDRAYRIISFIMLGAILLIVSYFYQRGRQPAEET